MNSKTKFTLMATAMVAVTLLAIVSIMAVFAARQQTFSTSITVVYKSTNVEGTASAQWKLGQSYYNGSWNLSFSSAWNDMDDNGALAGGETEIDLSSNGPLSLSPAESIDLTDEYPAVVLKYSFTNSATHPYTLSFTYQPNSETQNINAFYSASSQEIDNSNLGYISNNFTNTLETTVLGGESENIYILLKIDDLGSNSNFDGTFNIKLDGITNNFTEDYVYLYDGTNAMLTGAVDKEARTLDTTNLTYNDEIAVTKIGDYVFQNNTSLQTVKLNGIEEIGSHAFDGCSNLEILTIGEDVKFVGTDAFIYLTNLTNLNYNAIDANMICTNGQFRSAGELSSGVDVVIGDSVRTIPEYFLRFGGGPSNWNPNVLSIKFGANIETIGNFAFGSGLKENIVIPDSVKTIGSAAFSSEVTTCVKVGRGVNSIIGKPFSLPNLETLIVDPENEKFTSCDNDGKECNAIIDKNSYTLTVGCKSSIIPSDGSVTEIGDGAFSFCVNLTHIDFPDTITTIGEGAFSGCSALTELTIPKNIKKIGLHAFGNLESLQTINYYAENVVDLNGNVGPGSGTSVFGYRTGEKEKNIVLTIGENVKHIPAILFVGYYGSSYPYIKTVIINSADVYKELTGKGPQVAGDLLGCVEGRDNQGVVKVKADIVDGNDMPEYLQTNYTKSVAVDGYYTFTKIVSD